MRGPRPSPVPSGSTKSPRPASKNFPSESLSPAMGPPAPEVPSRTPGSMARKPTEEAISTWKTRKQIPADAKANGTTNLLFIAASSSTSNMGPEQARAQRLKDLCFLGAADFYFEGTAAADRLLQAQPPRKRPQPGQNTDEN